MEEYDVMLWCAAGALPAELPGLGALCGNGQALPVLLLCSSGHILVCHDLHHTGSVASDSSKAGQQYVSKTVAL